MNDSTSQTALKKKTQNTIYISYNYLRFIARSDGTDVQVYNELIIWNTSHQCVELDCSNTIDQSSQINPVVSSSSTQDYHDLDDRESTQIAVVAFERRPCPTPRPSWWLCPLATWCTRCPRSCPQRWCTSRQTLSARNWSAFSHSTSPWIDSHRSLFPFCRFPRPSSSCICCSHRALRTWWQVSPWHSWPPSSTGCRSGHPQLHWSWQWFWRSCTPQFSEAAQWAGGRYSRCHCPGKPFSRKAEIEEICQQITTDIHSNFFLLDSSWTHSGSARQTLLVMFLISIVTFLRLDWLAATASAVSAILLLWRAVRKSIGLSYRLELWECRTKSFDISLQKPLLSCPITYVRLARQTPDLIQWVQIFWL